MYTTNMELFKNQQKELQRQAEEIRLIRSLEKSRRRGGGLSGPVIRQLQIADQNAHKVIRAVR